MGHLVNLATETEQTHRQFLQEIESNLHLEQRVYFRFNATGLKKVGLSEWEENDRVEIITREYAKKKNDRLEECARQMKADSSTYPI